MYLKGLWTPLGGEAPSCTPAPSSPCVEGAWRRGFPGEWRKPSGPLPVPGQLSGGRSCSSNHRPLEISGRPDRTPLEKVPPERLIVPVPVGKVGLSLGRATYCECGGRLALIVLCQGPHGLLVRPLRGDLAGPHT